MVVGVFPALKLGVLFIKQISKPLAKVLVNQAKNHPVFRTYFIIPPAQFYHWAEVTAKMHLMNLGKPTKVAKLNEAMAIELGANLMGEVIIFGVAGGCLILEYNRQVAKEAKKEEARLAQIQKFVDEIEELQKTTTQQDTEIQYLQSAIEELAKHSKYKLPPPPDKRKPVHNGSQDSNSKLKADGQMNIEMHDIDAENKSVIQRAIVYYKNNVLRDKLN